MNPPRKINTIFLTKTRRKINHTIFSPLSFYREQNKNINKFLSSKFVIANRRSLRKPVAPHINNIFVSLYISISGRCDNSLRRRRSCKSWLISCPNASCTAWNVNSLSLFALVGLSTVGNRLVWWVCDGNDIGIAFFPLPLEARKSNDNNKLTIIDAIR